MESHAKPDAGNVDAAFADAAERFLGLIRAFWGEAARPPGNPRDLPSLAGRLAEELEQWLRASGAAHPWGSSDIGFNNAVRSALPFAPLPLGPRTPHAPDWKRTLDLITRFAQLQAQLAVHWGEIARTSGRRLTARLDTLSIGSPNLESVMDLYDLWIDCAEQAYADTVRQNEFCRVQTELANTASALLVEQRKQAETLARAFGMPTRTEVDALHRRVKELQSELRAPRSGSKGDGLEAKRRRASRSRRRRI